MKIKVIDLLNMMENGKEVPKIIAFEGDLYEKFGRTYYSGEKSFLGQILFVEDLTQEVEIIEENKKIEHCIGFQHFENIGDYTEHLRAKIDEIIDVVNEFEELKEK